MTARFTLEMPEELLARVDEARGDVARNRWIRRAVERALSEPTFIVDRQSAWRPMVQEVPVRSSAQAKRNVKPIPKNARK